MISRAGLLADLKKLVGRLEDDLRERCAAVPELDQRLRAEFEAGRNAHRTGVAYEVWREGELTQSAVAWVLGCVFVRFLEDNGFLTAPLLAGPNERLRAASDHHTLFFQRHPTLSDREYLEDVFREVGSLPAAQALFDERHNPLWLAGISGDGARELLAFWRRIDPATGALVHDFTDPDTDTRFLGDLYQDLSESARKQYALLQTPEFVEEFILDRTLTPAIDTFGYKEVRLIDPTCGSGHFLLGAFRRLLALGQRHEPGANPRVLVQRALDQVAGVDVNPYAAAIARFRLLIAALRACAIENLADAPGFTIHVAAGDSLLHGPNFTETRGVQLSLDPESAITHVFQAEDRHELARILGRRYHVVVGNPPYITVKDKELNQAYRQRYRACHRQYSLAVPFMQRFFELAQPADGMQPAGYVGMITANSFMKREFGKKLIEEWIPRWDLTHVVDTSGAYIPGHGTPTVILFGRHQSPVADVVRAVMGIRGEPSTPADPAQGQVWSAIGRQIDQSGSESDYVSSADTARTSFHSHPWSIGGGGAVDLKELIESRSSQRLSALIDPPIGRAVRIAEEDAFIFDAVRKTHSRCPNDEFRGFLIGENVRDWSTQVDSWVWYPYSTGATESAMLGQLWNWRTTLANRSTFQGIMKDAGLAWYEYMQHTASAYRTPLSIAFAFVATHNHFVLDRGGKVFKQSAPVIKLPPEASEDDHIALLGLLNSSVACFWMKQVFHNKGATSDAGVLQSDPEKFRFEFDGTKLGQLPVPLLSASDRESLIGYARLLNEMGSELSRDSFRECLDSAHTEVNELRSQIDRIIERRNLLRSFMVRHQEELDWLAYRVYGLLPDEFRSVDGSSTGSGPVSVGLSPGDRPYRWNGVRAESPECDVKRWHAIRAVSEIGLIERPEYKRRWFRSAGAYDDTNLSDDIILARALRSWLLDRLEDSRHWPNVELTSCAQLADRVRLDEEFLRVAELYRGHAGFDLTTLVTELVVSEAVPYLPVLRYQPGGLRKRELWERTWDLQRREDAGETVGDIPVPPKYTSADFLKSDYWRLRGKLDVPKERFVLFPGAERDADPTPVLAWAGWDHLQQAQALAANYVRMHENEGWPTHRLVPLLAGLLELLPWLRQWHNDLDPTYGVGLGDYFRDFVGEEARTLGVTEDDLRRWQPEKRIRGRNKPAKAADE